MSLKSLSNEVLLKEIRDLTEKEQLILADVLRYLREIEQRKSLINSKAYWTYLFFAVLEWARIGFTDFIFSTLSSPASNCPSDLKSRLVPAYLY